jgi:predicted dehydrogenase
VGLGYWGPNLARNFDRLPEVELAWLCDESAEALDRLSRAFPGARATASFHEVLGDQSLDAVALATPVSTHAELARQVLEAGKHCFVEKPLGAHDVSVILRLAAEEPYECRAVGESYVHDGVEDVVFCYLRFPSALAAHMHLSWLDPHKERRFTVVGSKRMATFDDMELERKLSVYDKGFDEDYSSYGEYIARSGDIFSPHVPNEEPLRIECRHFLDCVRERARPRSGAESGLRVVRVLEALQRSLQESSRAAPV